MKMKTISILIILPLLILAVFSPARGGIYLGLQGGFSAQKPSLKDVEFNTDTTYLYGFRAGVRFMMMGLELNYFQAAHNLELADIVGLDWGGRDIDYNFIGLNLKYFFPLMAVHPYITAGYGYYSANIENIDKDREKGYNFGLGVELMLGRKFSLIAEGKYHLVDFNIDDKELEVGDFTLSGGFNIHF